MRLVLKLVWSVVFVSVAQVALAGDNFKLDVSMLEKFSAAQQEMKTLDDKYPELGKDFELGMLLTDQGSALVQQIKDTDAYGEVTSIVKKNGFKSVSQYVELMSRVMAASMAIQMESLPAAERERLNQTEEEMRKTLLESGADEAMVQMQMEFASKMMKTAKIALKASENASKEDVEFVRANQEAVKSALQ